VGLGKTHLVNAIGHQVLDRNENARVVFLSSESFMNELIAALRRDRMDEFKARFRRIDVLIVDDVQFLAGRERTQEEFFHTFNSLYDGHHQIVLTSDKFPKEIPDLEERLRNRFEWGLIADIQPPDVETRIAILEKKAEFEGIELPQDVANFLATNIDSNVRELEGSLTRLGAFASLNKCPITVDFARDVLQSVLRDRTDRAITIESIQKAVCDFFRIRPNDLRSKRRTRTDSATAPGRHVSVPSLHQRVVSGHRRPLRRPRSLHGDPRRPGHRAAAARGSELPGDGRAPRAALGTVELKWHD
jgi:chromosomal replication initiator protein